MSAGFKIFKDRIQNLFEGLLIGIHSRPDLVGRPLAFESFYHFVEFPKLNVEAINERLGLLSGASFIFASQIDPVVNVAVWTRMKARYSGMVLRCLLRLL